MSHVVNSHTAKKLTTGRGIALHGERVYHLPCGRLTPRPLWSQHDTVYACMCAAQGRKRHTDPAASIRASNCYSPTGTTTDHTPGMCSGV